MDEQKPTLVEYIFDYSWAGFYDEDSLEIIEIHPAEINQPLRRIIKCVAAVDINKSGVGNSIALRQARMSAGTYPYVDTLIVTVPFAVVKAAYTAGNLTKLLVSTVNTAPLAGVEVFESWHYYMDMESWEFNDYLSLIKKIKSLCNVAKNSSTIKVAVKSQYSVKPHAALEKFLSEDVLCHYRSHSDGLVTYILDYGNKC